MISRLAYVVGFASEVFAHGVPSPRKAIASPPMKVSGGKRVKAAAPISPELSGPWPKGAYARVAKELNLSHEHVRKVATGKSSSIVVLTALKWDRERFHARQADAEPYRHLAEVAKAPATKAHFLNKAKQIEQGEPL